MNFAQLISVLKARKWIALAILLVVVLTTLVVSLSLPQQYQAAASIVVDARPDPVTGIGAGGAVAPSYMATQLDIIQSDRVSRRLVRNLGLADNPQVRQQWLAETGGNGTIESWLGDTFQRYLDVKPSRDSNVIIVSYTSPDPQFAATLANGFVKAYIDTVIELRVDPARQYSAFFDSRAKEAREGLERAQAKLSAFQRDKGIIANDERFDIENARLSELSTQVVLLQALAVESQSRQAQAVGASSDRIAEVLNNPLISGLKADQSRAEARLQEISARLGENHPQVKEAQANIAELRSRIETETKRVSGGVGVTNTINRQREAQIRAELETQRAKVLRLKAVRDEGSVLAREVESAQRTYDAVLGRFTQTSLESQSTQTNVNVLTEASVPRGPSSPKVLLNTALSVVLGLLLAIGTVLGLEMIDRRVRGVSDIDNALGLPLLGVMPKPAGRRMIGGSRVSPMQQRLMAPAAAKGA